MPPLKRNPKFDLWKKRADAEGTTSANRQGTDEFVESQVPNVLKPSVTNVISGYRTAVDLPGHLFKVATGVMIFYLIYSMNAKK